MRQGWGRSPPARLRRATQDGGGPTKSEVGDLSGTREPPVSWVARRSRAGRKAGRIATDLASVDLVQAAAGRAVEAQKTRSGLVGLTGLDVGKAGLTARSTPSSKALPSHAAQACRIEPSKLCRPSRLGMP